MSDIKIKNNNTRFAPSNTGMMHIGGAKAAILPYIYSKTQNSKFILRLDNTDITRSKDIYTQEIHRSMKWLNINHDIYFEQQHRIERYNEITEKLIANGSIYKSYDTNDKLDIIKKAKKNQKIAPTITKSDCTLEGSGDYTLRFNLNENHRGVKIKDGVYGEQIFKNHLSDPIIRRSDGTYTYIYASVIDDIDYNVGTIIRGNEHLANGLVQKAIGNDICQLLFNDFWKVKFIHYPLFLDKQGKKLSKRDDSLNLAHMNRFEPQTIWSFVTGVNNQYKFFTNFEDYKLDFSKISKNAQILDLSILEYINKKILKTFTKDMVEERGGNWQLWKLGLPITYWDQFIKISDTFKKAKETSHYQEWKKSQNHSKEYMIETYQEWLGIKKGPKIIDLINLLDNM